MGNNLIYIIGLIVVVILVLAFFGLGPGLHFG